MNISLVVESFQSFPAIACIGLLSYFRKKSKTVKILKKINTIIISTLVSQSRIGSAKGSTSFSFVHTHLAAGYRRSS